jgi:hypothetical protein
MPVDYNNSKIYKIVCNVTGLVYIGSTCQSALATRLSEHRRKYKLFLNQKYTFVTSFKVLENNNYDIILIEQYPCNSKQELHKKERFYIESIKCVNKYIPNRTIKEYYNDNREKIKEKMNKKFDCECGSNYTTNHKARHYKSLKHIKYCQTII